MSVRARTLIALACGLAAACRNLADVPANQCGNRVVEQGETCDGDSVKSCLPPGAAGECHFDCALRTDGTRPECPSGSGCDIGGVCREATGGYLPPSATITDNATSLIAADFDGDGRADIVSQESISVLGGTKFRLHYFDRDGTLAQTWISARPLISLVAGHVSDERTNDVVFTDRRIGVLVGQPDRTLISETYPSYYLPSTKIRVAGAVSPESLDDSAALVILTEDIDGLSLRHPDSGTRSLQQLAPLPSLGIDALAGPLVVGDLFGSDTSDPCDDTALAFRGTTEAHVFSVCLVHPDTDLPGWREAAVEHVVPLDPPEPITSGPVIGDVDGDGHLDLVIGTEHVAYVAYGDGLKLTAARPWEARVDGTDATPITMPLAVGDFTGDGPIDLVYPAGFAVSKRRQDRSIEYSRYDHGFGELWTSARVADLNANGKLDVIAVSETKLDIDFYNGTDTDYLNRSVIPTQRPVRDLTVGDFDGDLVNDLAYLQIAPAAEPTEIMVSFGNLSGPPLAGVTAARASGVVQIGALNYDVSDQAAELFLANLQPDADGGEGSSFAWLTGADRRLVCLVELTTSFVADGSIETMQALSMALGEFTGAGQHGALVLGAKDLRVDDVGLWVIPDLRSGTSQPQYLGWDLDPDVKPLRGSESTTDTGVPELDVLMAAGDLDQDGVDELALAAPSADGERCHVSIARVREDAGSYQLQSQATFSADAPCLRTGQIAVEDLDGDSARDILLLLGKPEEARSLLVFWNDGAGNFSADARSSLATHDDVPEAFSVYRPTPGDPLRLAYVTRDRLRVLQTQGRARKFEPAAGAAADIELQHATGVTAGDVDGDGIADLIVADSGNVILLRAQLKP